MREVDKQKMFDRYTQRISKFGHGAAALGEPRERQAFYFDFLSKVDGLGSSDSIIDIGCGYGDLGSYLRSCGWRGEYVGVDINPQLIEEGRKRYGDDAHLIVADIQETPLQRVADWCFCCAALTSATEGLPFVEHLESMLQLMWASSRKGLVFNLLKSSCRLHQPDPCTAVVRRSVERDNQTDEPVHDPTRLHALRVRGVCVQGQCHRSWSAHIYGTSNSPCPSDGAMAAASRLICCNLLARPNP